MDNNNVINNLPAKKWLNVQDVIYYYRNKNQILLGIKKGTEREALASSFNNIKCGDFVVYYAYEQHLVLGLYKVISDKLFGKDYTDNKIVYFEVQRLSPPNSDGFLDISKLAQRGEDKFSAFENGLLEERFIEQNLCREISEDDFTRLLKYTSEKELLSPISIDEKKVGVISALLDFYGDRATNFVSLFVASIFGIVTLSAIIQALNFKNDLDLFIILISIMPFLAFTLAGYYNLQKYFFYCDIAERLRYWGLIFPYYKDLRDIKEQKFVKGEDKVFHLEIDNLIDSQLGFVTAEERKRNVPPNLVVIAIKHLLSSKILFTFFYFGVLTILFVVVYYSALT